MFSKEKCKGILIGVILTLLLVSTVFAEEVREQIEVLYNDISIYIDGSRIETEKEPFIYEGYTYVPIRVISEALDKDVHWDSEKNSISIGSEVKSYIKMKDMNTITASSKDWKEFDTFTTNIMEEYSDGYHFYRSYSKFFSELHYEYFLNEDYDSFQVKIAPDKVWSTREKDENIGSFQFFADGGKIYDTGEIESDLTEPIEINLNLKDIVKFEIKGEGKGLGFIEPRFIK
ncbi:copper amine oxidase N-terminal domain-containing protein [Natranaerobius trueperi]|uniref:Copper amine oxidase-like N-terminal domain-containing protein n=1 Tax=Natranaerobius trueperi TaxID=759412 RepID=A0A226BY82_9FIRM|nr:copper amine oxidase N-terminal domain-containing protein [Natranaerobius trueperi]OWZ83159.1 hypothetical protein CDO51_10030 [Natranaerobius trueperi]